MKTQLLGGIDRERRFAIVMSTDDEIKESLQSFAGSLKTTGYVHGVGAIRGATIAFWNPETREYQHIEIEQQAEVLSLIGNLAVKNGEAMLHAHVVLGLENGHTRGGHLVNGIVHPTLELLFIESPATLCREKDAKTGLDLLQLL